MNFQSSACSGGCFGNENLKTHSPRRLDVAPAATSSNPDNINLTLLDDQYSGCFGGCFGNANSGPYPPRHNTAPEVTRSHPNSMEQAQLNDESCACEGGCLGSRNARWTESTEPSEMKDGNKLLAEEMNNLSIQERELVYEEIHGVGEVVNENEELVAASLDQLEIEISKITRKPAYTLAEAMSASFVRDRKLRLMFLRGCRFDAAHAATKFVKFFEGKLEYFGEHKLTKPIMFADLDDDTRKCVMSGRFQFLPCRDRSGRAVMFNTKKKLYAYKKIDSMVRAFWYMIMAIMEDEETQKHGLVIISYIIGCGGFGDPRESKLLLKGSRQSHSLPFRLAGIHLCFDNSKLLSLASVIMNGLDSANRVRARFHEGSHTESHFSLMTFGIPVDVLPVTDEGDIKTGVHSKWVEKRKIKEREIKEGRCFNGIDLPTRFDVLLGRGKPIQDHAGNVRLRQLMEANSVRYEKAAKGDKAKILNSIIQQIKQSPGRFIKQEKNGWWFEVSDEVAKQKGGHLLRSKVRQCLKTPKSNGSINKASEDNKRAKIQ